MNHHRGSSLIVRMVVSVILVLIPFLAVIAALFANAVESERQDALEDLAYTAGKMSQSLENVAYRAYSFTDALSDNEKLTSYLDRVYTDHLLKQVAIVEVLNRQFESYNRLGNYEKIDTIYVPFNDQVFDFLDPNQNEDTVRRHILEMGMNNKDKMGRFYWYPLQTNFLTTARYGDVRRNNVVFGSRRVYSAMRESYAYVHVFAVEERTLYEEYAADADRYGYEVYVLNRDGMLVSSTDVNAVRNCSPSVGVRSLWEKTIQKDRVYRVQNEDYYVCRVDSDFSQWTTLVLLPKATVQHKSEELYSRILIIALSGVLCSALALWMLHRRFMQPLHKMDESMKRVEEGDLEAYVAPTGQREMRQMLWRYNNMLRSIDRSFNRQLEMERTKKELEMQVLTFQINPHFLYNTLETIVWKAGEAGRPDIGRIASSLGKMYRLSLAGGTFVPLAQELEHLQAYATIQKNRHGDKVTLSVKLQNVDPAECRILKLCLQPIVENCYLYAGEGLDHRLRIRVLVQKLDGNLVIRITDNGVGMSPELLARTRKQMVSGKREENPERKRRSTGIGLHNIYARIHLYESKGSMRIISKEHYGTSIILTMPWEEP